MELGNQIKQHRNRMGLSQEELADRVYVSRQTISNWENDKNYPDIKSLLLLSSCFGVSLDDLVKGDMKEMKEQIQKEDIRLFRRHSWIYLFLLVVMVVLMPPVWFKGNALVIILWCILFAVTLIHAFWLERWMKHHDIQTYKEVVAFCEGRHLDEIEQQREYGKRPYQKFVMVLISALFGAVIGFVSVFLLW